MKPREVHEKLGPMCGLSMNEFVGGEPAGGFKLALPPALTVAFSHLDGFSSAETKRFLNSASVIQIDTEEEEIEEPEFLDREEERGVGHWKKEIKRLTKEQVAVKATVATRERLLQEAKDKLAEIDKDLKHKNDMLEFATEKLEIIPLHGTPRQKIEKMKIIRDLWRTVSNPKTTMEQKTNEFVEICGQAAAAPTPSKKRNLQPGNSGGN